VARALGAAYARLEYDAGYVTPSDDRELGDAASAVLKGGHDNEGPVTSRVVEKDGKRFGLVFMPELPDSGKGPTEAQMDAVMAEAEKLRPQVDMVIGLSPWGYQGEVDFLDRAKDKRGLDVLLGGGHGSGNRGKVMAGGRTLWMRPYPKGKAVSVVRVEQLPGEGIAPVWKENENSGFETIILDEQVPQEPGIEELLKPLRPTGASDKNHSS
jgi:hypothetical protein